MLIENSRSIIADAYKLNLTLYDTSFQLHFIGIIG